MTQSFPSRIASKVFGRIDAGMRRLKVAQNTKHVSGTKQIVLRDNETVLVCLLKDAAYYLEHLVAHHRTIGVKHFLFIDNGSSDKTRELFATAPDVTVYSNTLPAKGYECLLRSQVARQAVKGGWFLFADSDELMMFSRGEGRQLSDFTDYCNANKYDAVIGQVLDFFSPVSLKQSAGWPYPRSVKDFNLYSTNNISYFDYGDNEGGGFAWYLRENTVSNHDIKFMFGGIRNEVFGEDCCLTTHRMVRNAPHIDLYTHAHCSGNVTCADFTFLVKHYKFAGNFWERDRAQVQKSNWDHGEDRTRMSILQDQEDFVISGRQQNIFEDTEDLIAQGFLECSDRFLESFPKLSGQAESVASK
jgi:hypothetical protein